MEKFIREKMMIAELNKLLRIDNKYRENVEFVALIAIQLLNNKLIMTEKEIKRPNDRG